MGRDGRPGPPGPPGPPGSGASVVDIGFDQEGSGELIGVPGAPGQKVNINTMKSLKICTNQVMKKKMNLQFYLTCLFSRLA